MGGRGVSAVELREVLPHMHAHACLQLPPEASLLHLTQRRSKGEIDGNTRRMREGVRHTRILLHAANAMVRVTPPLLPLVLEEGGDLLGMVGPG